MIMVFLKVRPIASLRFLLPLLIGSTQVITRTHAQDWFKCALEETIFLNHQCHACVNSQESTVADVGYRTPLNLSDIVGPVEHIFSNCPKDLQDFTAAQMRRGAVALNGQELDVVTIHRPPFSMVNVTDQGPIYTGVIFDFLCVIHSKWNFSMNIFTSPDGQWGSTTKGSWNGMIGVILRKEADIGAASFSVTLERAAAVDFTTAFHLEPTAILIPAPTEGEKLTVLIRPLSPEVWLGLGLSVAVIIPTFYAIHVFSRSIHAHDKQKRTGQRNFLGTLTKLGLFITGTLVQESVISPMEKTTRLLLAIWWMVTIVMANTYTAFLVSFLAAPKLLNLVENLDELAAQTKLQWTFRTGTALYPLFKSETSLGIFKEIGDGVQETDLVTTDDDGVLKVLTGHWAFIKEKSYLDVALGKDFAVHGECRMTLADQEFFTVGFGLPVPKNSVYLPLLDHEISNMVATGLMDKLKRDHWPEELYCADAESHITKTRPKSRKLSMDDVQGVFFLFGAGLLVSICGLIAERFIHSATVATRKIQMSIEREKPKPVPWAFLK